MIDLKRERRVLEKLFFAVLKLLLIVFFAFITVYPLWQALMYSLSDSMLASSGGIFLWPRGFSLKAYKYILTTSKIYRVIFISIAKTAVGTLFSVLVTLLMAYPLAQSGLKGRRGIMFLFYFPMLFSGGMIPTFIVVKNLHLIDTFWAYVIPSALSLYNLFVMKTYIASIPPSLKEAAYIDGANHMQIFARIIVPLSKPSIASIALLEVRNLWNSYMDGVLYINDSNKELLQVYLMRLIKDSGADSVLAGQGEGLISATTSKMSILVIAMVPVLLLYAFLQKYFVKGMMVGGIKE